MTERALPRIEIVPQRVLKTTHANYGWAHGNKRLKELKPNLKIITDTAYEVSSSVREIFNAVLTKPVPLKDLVDPVTSLLEN